MPASQYTAAWLSMNGRCSNCVDDDCSTTCLATLQYQAHLKGFHTLHFKMTVLVCSVQVYKAAVCKVSQSACGGKSHLTQLWHELMDWLVSLQIQVTCDTTLAWTDACWLYLLAGSDFLQEPAWAGS